MFGPGRQLDWSAPVLDVLARWPKDQSVFLLHSGRLDPQWSRYSILASPVGAIRFTADTTQQRGLGADLTPKRGAHHPLRDLRTTLHADAGRSLWLGYLGYDTARWIEHLPTPPTDDRGWPVMQFERCTAWLVYDHLEAVWTAHGQYANNGPPTLTPQSDAPPCFVAGRPTPDQTREEYEARVRRVLEYIAAGDVFQVNLAQRFTSSFSGNPRALFASLATVSPAWYGCYGELTRFAHDEPTRTIVSTSPELFLQTDASRRVITRPIKGTLPTTAMAKTLRDSAKDAAELNMIIDLMRNDLGRVCSYGSVRVQQPRAIETHPTIHHGVATIVGQLHERKDLIDLLRATLPGGSITGAPKVRAMQIIDALEPTRRGPYCGAIGMIHGSTMRLNIAIRTMLIEQGRGAKSHEGHVDFSVGGGIVADSNPAAEYDETLAKAHAMMASLAPTTTPIPQ